MKTKLNRRDFITKSSMGIMATTAGIVTLGNAKGFSDEYGELPKIKEYRTLGRTGFRVSDIGCGCILSNSEGILKALIAAGVNFVDTSEAFWQNQEIIGKVVMEADRDSLFVNTKIMVAENEKPENVANRIKKFLERTGLNYINGMMLWNANTVKGTKNEAFQMAFESLKKEKLVQFTGISCHGTNYVDNPEDSMEDVVSTAILSGHYDIVMFVYNYVQHQMGENILKLCKQNNVGSLLMKTDPFGGYVLNVMNQVNDIKAKNDSIPANLKIVYDKYIQKQKEAQPFLQQHGYMNDQNYKKAALSFVLNHPQVSSSLISFRNFDDVNEYISLSGSRLDEDQISFIGALKRDFGFSYCRHACGKCETSCPSHVPVNKIMRYNHYYVAQGRTDYAIQKYKYLDGNNAAHCATCNGFCEQACPYQVSIQSLLTMAHSHLLIC